MRHVHLGCAGNPLPSLSVRTSLPLVAHLQRGGQLRYRPAEFFSHVCALEFSVRQASLALGSPRFVSLLSPGLVGQVAVDVSADLGFLIAAGQPLDQGGWTIGASPALEVAIRCGSPASSNQGST